MTEVWLKTNRRALGLGMVLQGMLLVSGLAAVVLGADAGMHCRVQLLLMILAAVHLWMICELLYAMSRPRVTYEARNVLVFLEPTRATVVPIDIVEVMFLGQGPSVLPKIKGKEPETQNVVIRLAESAVDWKHRDVRPAIGHWCEGYITIRGAWC